MDDGHYKFQVEWNTGEITWEPAKYLKEDAPDSSGLIKGDMESDGDSSSTPSSEDPTRSTSDASSDDSDSPPTHRLGILRGGDSDTDGMSWPSRLPKGSTYRQQERRRRRDAKRSVRFDVDLTQRRTNRMVKAIPNGPDPSVGSQSGDRLPDTHNFRQAERLAGKSNSLLFACCVREQQPSGSVPTLAGIGLYNDQFRVLWGTLDRQIVVLLAITTQFS